MDIARYKNLEANDLTKYGFSLSSERIKNFLSRYDKQQEFIIRKDGKLGKEQNIVLDKNKENKESIEKFKDLILDKEKSNREKNTEINKLSFYTQDGIKFNFKDFVKDEKLGGERVGLFEAAEIRSLSQQIENIKKKTGNLLVKVKVGIKIYHIKSIRKSKASVKSDIEFLDLLDNPIIWISSKKGSTAQGFQQWSGISEKSSSFISSNDETKKFVNTVSEKYPEGIPQELFIRRKITNPDIKKAAVYGKDFKNPQNGEDNVNMVIQGNIRLENIGNDVYRITGGSVFTNKRIPSGEYDPHFIGRYSSDRNDYKIPKTRLGIFPRNTSGNRKIEDI